MDAEPKDAVEKFDFARHEQSATTAYLKVANFYGDLAAASKRIVEEALKKRNIRVHSIEARAKDPTSFGRKAAKPSTTDPNRPMYADPLNQITDLSAIRIITFFPRTIEEIDAMLKAEFSVIEQLDKGENLIEEERFGYKSVHYLVKLIPARAALPEYERFGKEVSEVQVRTILQHAWAEIEHDIQYKSSITIPRDIKRRFMALAGLLEIADREFQAIQDADQNLTAQAKSAVVAGQLDEVEITPSSLKAYLDKKLGPDGRVSEFSYEWTARLLLGLGFRTLQQVDDCIRSYDDDRLSRVIDGYRQGQTTRFEYMLMAGMGNKYLQRHIWAGEPWFDQVRTQRLKALMDAGIPIGQFDPRPQPEKAAP